MARDRKPPPPPRELTDSDKHSWSLALQDVKPLKGKRRMPPPPISVEELRRKPIKAKTPVLRVAARSIYDGKLDLHGMTEAGAYQTLILFLKAELARGAKKLLIITGKGSGLSGVLRTQVPRWLDVEPFASALRSVEVAPPNLGGDGAYLITVKAKRK